MDGAKLGQITATKAGNVAQKNSVDGEQQPCAQFHGRLWCVRGLGLISAQTPGRNALSTGVTLPIILMRYFSKWECRVYYYINDKPKVFIEGEETQPEAAHPNPARSCSSWWLNALLPTALPPFLPCPPPSLSWTSSKELCLCHRSGRWWTPSSSPMLCVEASPLHPPGRIRLQGWPVPVPPYVTGLFSIKTSWGFAAIEMVSSEDLKH